jgi:hypothetical protein
MKYFLLIAILLFGMLLPPHSTKSAFHQLQSASAEPLRLTPDEVAKLVNECGARTTQMTRRLYNYTFNETDTEYVIDKQGRIKSEQSKVFEVYPIAIGKRSKWIYVQVSENGVPLSPERIAHERDRAARQTTELDQLAGTGQASQTATSYKPRFSSHGIRVEKHSGLSRIIWFINPTDFLVSHDFYAPQRVSLAGRDSFLLSFRPRPGYVYDKTNVPYPDGVEDYGHAMSQLGGRIWIDALDRVLVRLEAKPSRELSEPSATPNAAPDANAAVWFELTRLPNGIWVPSVSRYNSYGREDVFWKTPISRSRKYSAFKLFKTTADVEKIEPAPEKP